MTTRVFQLIDLDRTLFDTALFAKLITDEINKTQPGLGDELDARFETAYKKEETFFLLRYLREQMGDTAFEALVAGIVARVGSDAFFMPGAKERLLMADHLTSQRPAWGILTYGDEIDQRMKAKIMGLEAAPLLITDTADKAEVLRTWQAEDGTFMLPEVFGGQLVDTLTFEDDKLRAFYELPIGVLGVWISEYSDAETRLDTAALPHVATQKNLYDSLAYLQEALR